MGISGIDMKIFLLWFNEWEASHVLGIFETKDQAELWKGYFITNPTNTSYMEMEYYSKKDDYESRFGIEERTIGTLDPNIKIDNLKYLDYLFISKKDKNG